MGFAEAGWGKILDKITDGKGKNKGTEQSLENKCNNKKDNKTLKRKQKMQILTVRGHNNYFELPLALNTIRSSVYLTCRLQDEQNMIIFVTFVSKFI